jgi:hypothetical protein
MANEPITTIEEAKLALDEELASTRAMANIYRREEEEAKAKAAPYWRTIYALETIRKRMDAEPESPVVVQLAEKVNAA